MSRHIYGMYGQGFVGVIGSTSCPTVTTPGGFSIVPMKTEGGAIPYDSNAPQADLFTPMTTNTLRKQLQDSIIATDPPYGDIRWLIERRFRFQRGLFDPHPLLVFGYITLEELNELTSHEQRGVLPFLDCLDIPEGTPNEYGVSLRGRGHQRGYYFSQEF